jgi:hypothetical protein
MIPSFEAAMKDGWTISNHVLKGGYYELIPPVSIRNVYKTYGYKTETQDDKNVIVPDFYYILYPKYARVT